MGRDKQSGKSRKSSRKEAANDALPQGDLYGWSQDGQAGDYMPDKLGDINTSQWQTDDPTVPRTPTEQFDALNISGDVNDSYLATEEEYGNEEPVFEDEEISSGKHKSRSSKGKGKDKGKGKGKGNGKEPEPISEEYDEQNPPLADDGYEESYVLGGTTSGGAYASQDDWAQGASGEAYLEATGEDGFDEEFAMAIEESQAAAYAGGRRGESSTSYQAAELDYSSTADPLSVPEFLIRPSGKNTYEVRGTYGEEEESDPRFRLHSSWEFVTGAVFIVLWPEPRGATVPVPEDDAPTIVTKGEIYVTLRRFIVVATDEGHSTCVPILTYEGRACKKPGVKHKKHGIIYSHGSQARLLKGEPELGFEPVMLTEKYEVEDRLDRASRVNYSKLVTVEHNVKVRFLGMVEGWHFDIVRGAVDACWADKIRQPSKNSKHHHATHGSKGHKDKDHKKRHKHH